jgi:predicted RNase H-like nuclease (RuvC/YqgF family)
MAPRTRETISPEEFDRRLAASNERKQREVEEATMRVHQLEALIARKEVFVQRLDQMLAEIECAESEIAVLEKGLPASRPAQHARTERATPWYQMVGAIALFLRKRSRRCTALRAVPGMGIYKAILGRGTCPARIKP